MTNNKATNIKPAGEPLRIAQIAPLWMSVPPKKYGGSELILSLLSEELVHAGHNVTLFASGDSITSAHLHPVVNQCVTDVMSQGCAYEYQHYANMAMATAIMKSDEFDIIHSHLGCSYVPFFSDKKGMMLHTIHIPLSIDDQWVLGQCHGNASLAMISKYQADAVPSSFIGNSSVVHHGIDFGCYEFSEHKGEYLLFLGRMGPQKAPLHAIQIAKAVGMPLVLAGEPQNAEEKQYFENKIKPHIDKKNITHVGSVNHKQKNLLLKQAAALLFPIQGPEAFGLVMIEAMACGTPVLGWARASVVEIIDQGETGFYSDSLEKLVSLVPKTIALNRLSVREKAMKRFSHKRMVSDYLNIYQKMIQMQYQ